MKTLPAAYFDSSVLVKTYLRESGSARGRRLVRMKQVVTSSITGLELVSAFRRNLAAGLIDERVHAAIVERFQEHREKFRLVELTPTVLENAERYVAGFNVRALDALQIASAVVSRERFPKDLPFVTADSRQRDVAVQLGLQVIWVE